MKEEFDIEKYLDKDGNLPIEWKRRETERDKLGD